VGTRQPHPSQHTTAARHAARCPRCGDYKQHGDVLCDPCFQAEPYSCRRCQEVDYLLGGLCPDCHLDELGADLDVDAPIPFALTSQAEAALARDRRERALFDSNIPEGWWEPEGAWS